MGTFRVKLNLQYYYQDYRKHVFILVDKEWPNVKSLMDHIVRIFKIDKHFILTTEDGTYLSNIENINIVLPSDVLIAQPLNKSDILATASTVSDPETILNSKKKRKNEVKQDAEISSVLDPLFSSSIIDFDCEIDDLNQSEAVAERRKRRRIRKKKDKTVKTPESVVTLESNKYIKENPKIINNRIDVSSEKVHIRFNEDGSALGNGTRERESTKIYHKRTIPRVITAIREQHIINENNESNDKEELSQITPADTSIMKLNEKSLSYWWENEMEIDTQKEPEKCEVEKTVPTAIVNENLESLRQNIDNLKLPKISSDPKQFDTIAFKILTMTDNFMPQLSNYIIGMIDSFNENNQETKITILAGKSELKKPVGKFSLPPTDDEEHDESFNNDLLEIQWNEVHDARSLETGKI